MQKCHFVLLRSYTVCNQTLRFLSRWDKIQEDIRTGEKDKVAAKMLHLRSPQMLQMLEKSLRKYLPESLKVYGTVFHMNQGNPFKLKALVDKWPDFNTVIVRPQEQEMTDDLDPHTNTYQIYSKNPKNCLEFLGTPEIINWKQHLQIQSSQSSLNEAIMSIADAKLIKVKRSQSILYMMPQTAKKLVPFLMENTENLHNKPGRPRGMLSGQSGLGIHLSPSPESYDYRLVLLYPVLNKHVIWGADRGLHAFCEQPRDV
nr:glycine N-acyltransferase-like protein isoform X2 [Peromyscus maniculatus bairdii]